MEPIQIYRNGRGQIALTNCYKNLRFFSPKKLGAPKLSSLHHFLTILTLNDDYLHKTCYGQTGTALKLQGSATLFQNFINCGPQTAKIGTNFSPPFSKISQLSGECLRSGTCHRQPKNDVGNGKGSLITYQNFVTFRPQTPKNIDRSLYTYPSF